MTDIADGMTISAAFAAAVATHADKPFFVVPANAARGYLESGFEISYREAAERVGALVSLYRAAGYGLGHRVATLLENRPDYVLHKLALNYLGVCCVPINPEYRAGEIAYLLEHSEPELVIVLPQRRQQVLDALPGSAHRPAVVALEEIGPTLPAPSRPARSGAVAPETPACVLYTSGTTGRPKGCVLTHGYEVAAGARYASLGGLAALHPGQDRIYNPLPLYHANAATFSLMAAILTGNCQVQPDRFRPQHWWREIAETRATVAHYLGIIVPVLLAQPASDAERAHRLRFAIGAGVEPELHQAAEERFGFPLIEVWGMTEMVRVIADNQPPRHVGTRAFGAAFDGIEARVVDDGGGDVPDGSPGELLVRHSAATPRRGFFSGYLKDDAATEAAWHGGWFHTGDVVWRGAGGMLHFVDRKKNIIRRSGENIAAAEVEALLLTHPDVQQVAVMAVKDELREEEVLACIVLKQPASSTDLAGSLVKFCLAHIAYYKAPGWIHFVQELPTTGTQKIQKHNIYPKGIDPRSTGELLDMRPLKRRQAT
ncbi:AMP-binding protein [Reyranella sp.]|uniref:AMP-binding protein n=1 Tax=Reyranella sp. TaxID=1929291 RepID=UPI003783A04B